ncbi:hypothetical protein FIT70_04325 [Candidatus Methylopumilus universalis]|uniref:hypothetical protein n=1 Tax=Candidatus Methylopumilus universalis TaxID=2588536 RepID=UPI00111DF7DC|nr:hypothetical protein [Candidatus Methylopumilus universalis]QDC99138.1 hypothetical protein FIT70_04325 [Candidatus Methylopumilus universalis]
MDQSQISFWLTLTGLSGLFLFADLGINSFFANYVSTKANRFRLDKMAVNIIICLAVIAISYFLILYSFKAYLIKKIISSQGEMYTEIFNSTYLIFIILSSFSMITNGFERILFGQLKMHYLHIYSICGYLLTMIFLFLSNFYSFKLNITLLLLLNLIVPIFVNLILFIKFNFRQKLFRNFLNLSNFKTTKKILVNSFPYLVSTLAYVILITGDYFIAIKYYGIFGLVGFNLCQRIFQIVIQPLYLINNQFWGQIAFSKVNNNITYLRTKSFLKSFNVFYTLCMIFFLYFSINTLGLILSNDKHYISDSMYSAFALRSILEVITLYFIVVHGASTLILRNSLPILFFSILIFSVKFLMINFYDFEISIIVSSCISILFFTMYFRKLV